MCKLFLFFLKKKNEKKKSNKIFITFIFFYKTSQIEIYN